MPNLLFRVIATLAASCLLFAPVAAARAPAREDLLHHRFVLESVDGVPFPTRRDAPDIEFNEGFRVSARICNRHMGMGRLENGVLTVGRMASTKMACPDAPLSRFEAIFVRMLEAGAELDLTGNTLTVSQGGHVLVYRLRDWVR